MKNMLLILLLLAAPTVTIIGYYSISASAPALEITTSYARQNVIDYARRTGNPTDSATHISSESIRMLLPGARELETATDYSKWVRDAYATSATVAR